jgi:hypothetical protein|uniref:Uncharacterized protein n=1 Tax=Ignisphaera aggregans TaxID=334771 RepID=A0A7J3Z7T5_9CREN
MYALFNCISIEQFNDYTRVERSAREFLKSVVAIEKSLDSVVEKLRLLDIKLDLRTTLSSVRERVERALELRKK